MTFGSTISISFFKRSRYSRYTGVHRRKEDLSQEYLNLKYHDCDASIFEYETVKAQYEAKHKTMSKFVRNTVSTIDDRNIGKSQSL